MAVILKPRSNKQGIVDTSADLIKIEGRDNYTVLVKDLGVFEWLPTGTVDSSNIFAGKVGVWSRVIQSAESLQAYTAENEANKSTDVIVDGASDIKYPSVKAAKTYADSLVTGLLDDRGNFTPGGTSPGAWPTTGGSGTAGAIMKGDIWFCDASGFMGTTAVVAGASFRATVDTPGQTAGNWNVLSAGAISTATPTLQQVTDAGATTNDDVSISSGGTYRSFTVTSTGGNGTARIAYDTSWKGHLLLNNGSFSGVLRANNLTASRSNIQLPDADGTLAITKYKVFSAQIIVNGGALIIIELENTIDPGNILALTYGTGSFGIGSSGKFTDGKTLVFIGAPVTANPNDVIHAYIGSTNLVPIKSWRSGIASNEPLAFQVSVEIRVYP
jgi:hypothetical protein